MSFNNLEQIDKAWSSFLNEMPSEERQRLRSLGITGPDRSMQVHKGSDLLFEAENASVSMAAPTDLEIQEAKEQLAEAASVLGIDNAVGILANGSEQSHANAVQEALRLFLCEFADRPQPQLEMDCLSRALGMPMPELPTLRAIAAKHRVSHQVAHNREKHWRELLSLPHSSTQKSATASAVYRRRNRRQTKIKV